ncbi:MAG: YbhB/YbcL family Raf kinase inhibitor-like protein [Plesiomonas sp.]|uniref:YbhB/YbcL family Raf kinase inhibitor-like protein n=1 Tax=Plesiomonas sp. TaxID=2486279 RepID=UPI003F3C3AF3
MSNLQSHFTLSSSELNDGDFLLKRHAFNGFGHQGQNLSPALQWKNAPAGTKSFALTIHDSDAPTGSGWWHWVVFNIPANTHALPAGVTPEGLGLPTGAVQSLTDFGFSSFGGPCPPEGHGIHHYTFTLYALSVESLDLTANTMPAMVGFMLNANMLAKTSFTALYQY